MKFVVSEEDLISIGVSILCGSILGFEREYNNKSAGFRTIILICLGSTIFTIVSRHGAGSDDRIAANIITGIGFIGAGVIFKDKLSVLGLTTAAVIWTAAGIGMATGVGSHLLAFVLTACTIAILSMFGRIEHIIDLLEHTKTINLTFGDTDLSNVTIVEDLLKLRKIRSKRLMITKLNGKLTAAFKVMGSQQQFIDLNEELILMERVIEYY